MVLWIAAVVGVLGGVGNLKWGVWAGLGEVMLAWAVLMGDNNSNSSSSRRSSSSSRKVTSFNSRVVQ